jgi:TRAP-type mannitol/chloroaromatic compound transport system permease small subunit
MAFIPAFTKLLDRLCAWPGRIAAWLCLLLALLTVEQVIARYWFQGSSIGLQELQWHIYGAIFMWSMAWTLQTNGQVRVDVFYHRWGPKRQAFVDLLGHVFFLLPLCTVLIFYGCIDVELARSYPSQQSIHHLSEQWLGENSSLYSFASPTEAWLRTWLLVGEGSPMSGGLEARWIPKAFIPFGACLLAIQGVAQILKALSTLFCKTELS